MVEDNIDGWIFPVLLLQECCYVVWKCETRRQRKPERFPAVEGGNEGPCQLRPEKQPARQRSSETPADWARPVQADLLGLEGAQTERGRPLKHLLPPTSGCRNGERRNIFLLRLRNSEAGRPSTVMVFILNGSPVWNRHRSTVCSRFWKCRETPQTSGLQSG